MKVAGMVMGGMQGGAAGVGGAYASQHGAPGLGQQLTQMGKQGASPGGTGGKGPDLSAVNAANAANAWSAPGSDGGDPNAGPGTSTPPPASAGTLPASGEGQTPATPFHPGGELEGHPAAGMARSYYDATGAMDPVAAQTIMGLDSIGRPG